MTPFTMGTIAACAATLMIAVQFAGYDWFIIQVGSFRFALWILVAIYAALQFFIWRTAKKHMVLSDKEVARWGDKLSLATPAILRLSEAQTPIKEIVREIESSHAIPADVTLRYIIALGTHVRHANYRPPNEIDDDSDAEGDAGPPQEAS